MCVCFRDIWVLSQSVMEIPYQHTSISRDRVKNPLVCEILPTD